MSFECLTFVAWFAFFWVQHIDESIPQGRSKRTEYTLLVYLTGGALPVLKGEETLEGGETCFYDANESLLESVQPIAGMALLHIHGSRCLTHQANEVLRGKKYVLRSDIVFG